MKKEIYEKLYCGNKLFNVLEKKEAIFIEIMQVASKESVLVKVLEKNVFDEWDKYEVSLRYFLKAFQLYK